MNEESKKNTTNSFIMSETCMKLNYFWYWTAVGKKNPKMKFVYNVCFNFNQFILVSIYYATSIILSLGKPYGFSDKKKTTKRKIKSQQNERRQKNKI